MWNYREFMTLALFFGGWVGFAFFSQAAPLDMSPDEIVAVKRVVESTERGDIKKIEGWMPCNSLHEQKVTLYYRVGERCEYMVVCRALDMSCFSAEYGLFIRSLKDILDGLQAMSLGGSLYFSGYGAVTQPGNVISRLQVMSSQPPFIFSGYGKGGSTAIQVAKSLKDVFGERGNFSLITFDAEPFESRKDAIQIDECIGHKNIINFYPGYGISERGNLPGLQIPILLTEAVGDAGGMWSFLINSLVLRKGNVFPSDETLRRVFAYCKYNYDALGACLENSPSLDDIGKVPWFSTQRGVGRHVYKLM